MNRHPAVLMLAVWLACAAVYAVLPFQLLSHEFTANGLLVLTAFISAFILGTVLMPTPREPMRESSSTLVQSKRAEFWLMVASVSATVFLVIDLVDKNALGLAAINNLRAHNAAALLKAEVSHSSGWFQAAFLLYPAAYVYTAVHALYAPTLRYWKLVVYGILPIALATVAMGGRTTALLALLIAWISLNERSKVYPVVLVKNASSRKLGKYMVWITILALLVYYFSLIFLVRAAAVGGSIGMFELAENMWGVSFRGPMTDTLSAIFGEDFAYLVFVFGWYFVQGIVMSNLLFTSYDEPLQLGIYGIDLVSGVMRRLDPHRVAEGFDSLLNIGAYGFFPSAWGSLYVDFSYFGLVFCIAWGWWASLCFRRLAVEKRKDWLLFGPFVSLGIAFSTINTPLGFSNGLVTHSWLALAFLLLANRTVQAELHVNRIDGA